MNQFSMFIFLSEIKTKKTSFHFSRRGAVVPGRQGTQQFSSGSSQRSGGNFVSI
jgi:hypothetical protein